MKKLIKRADGSYSQRGLWDNIRANKGSGKKPTKEMLKQENKIKSEDMKNEYKKGGKKKSSKVMNEAKREKESFIKETNEIEFGKASPMGMGGMSKYKSGGKSMKPGGGGRFAAMVSDLKGEGKSTESAKAIAASVGRKKYGKSRFQEMAAAGKKNKYKKGGAEVPECGPGQFWDGHRCVDSKTNQLPEPDFVDELINSGPLATYDKKTGKREFTYNEGILDDKGRGITVDYDELKRQQKEGKTKKKKW